MLTDLNAARRGDLAAFNRLVAAHQDQLYALSYRALGDELAATEAVQAAVWQARCHIQNNGAGRFQLWLLQWGVQICQERLRRAGPTRSTREAGWQAFLGDLPEDLRLAIILVDVVGLGYPDAATVLGASREQVVRWVAKARGQLMGRPHDWARSAG